MSGCRVNLHKHTIETGRDWVFNLKDYLTLDLNISMHFDDSFDIGCMYEHNFPFHNAWSSQRLQ